MLKKIDLNKENAIDIIQFAASTDDGITLKYNVIMERKSPLIMLQEIDKILTNEHPMNAFDIVYDHRRTKSFSVDEIFENEYGTCWHYLVCLFVNTKGKDQKVKLLINLEDGEENSISDIINTISNIHLMDYGAFQEVISYKKRSDILRVFTEKK